MKKISLTDAEWEIMECLWDVAPQTGREIAESMKKKMSWARTTTLTVLGRLEGKGAIAAESSGGMKAYSPLISRDAVAIQETESLLNRVYQGSLSMLVSSLTKYQKLTKQDVEELYDILNGWEEK